jgi:carbonic anhydrase
MRALLNPEGIRESMPAMCAWLGHAEAARRVVREKYGELGPADLLNVAIQENVLLQLENLRTHPAVAAALAGGELKLHGWVYKIETGEVFAYDPVRGQFLPVTDGYADAAPAKARPGSFQQCQFSEQALKEVTS